MSDTDTPTTTHPCPDWCDGLHPWRLSADGLPEDFGIETATGQPIRNHERLTKGAGFLVWLSAEERITPDGPMLTPITIGASATGTDDCDALSPAVARKLADALWVAAEAADTIEAQR